MDKQLLALHILAESTQHLNLVRGKPCMISNNECMGSVVPAHLKTVGAGCDRKRPSFKHFATVPLCNIHHMEQEGHTRRFERKYQVDLALYAMQLMIETLTGNEACWHNHRGW